MATLMFPLNASFAVWHKRALLRSDRPRLRLPNSPLGHTLRAKRLSLLGLHRLEAYEHDYISVSSSQSIRNHYARRVDNSALPKPLRPLPTIPKRWSTIMSSLYTSPPSSPIGSFFPTGPASPHAFSSFQQDPRSTHTMYSALGSSTAHNIPQGHSQPASKKSMSK
ncbi:hypothetical protein K466DRAFT_294874 [Polyporus arcularius HHB13444]|uniref:Uncharacterized protein n=1 Tax=Polyporus arcularius HHB13444 TaxID=1314778 RepID=A0A5C3NYV8_9APHY|nr:hypothetical protein K466DRAFT_294874 [Polyporus arcularius HHB13444]